MIAIIPDNQSCGVAFRGEAQRELETQRKMRNPGEFSPAWQMEQISLKINPGNENADRKPDRWRIFKMVELV